MKTLHHATHIIQRGGIIAYPTEAVYGLGCDPFNESAVNALLTLKQRPIEKGLIIVASQWEQVSDLTLPVPEAALQIALEHWPGPYTWVFPASSKAPQWITGQFPSVAVRVSAHPVVQALCTLAGPLVSTSANLSNQAPCKTAAEVAQVFGDQINLIVPGEIGQLTQPTTIRNVLTREVIRN